MPGISRLPIGRQSRRNTLDVTVKFALLILALLACFAPADGTAQRGTASGGSSNPTPAAAILSGVDSLSLVYQARRHRFLDSALAQALSPHGGPFWLTRIASRTILRGAPGFRDMSARPPYDRIERELWQRNLNSSPVLDFGSVVRSFAPGATGGRARKPPRARPEDLPLPTETEIGVLTVLWESGPRTGLELYAALDSSLLADLTAETFWEQMHRMANRGFVHERLISPQNTITIAIGPVSFPLEMSRKNRRNRLYAYEPLVDRDELLRYLQARAWLAEHAAANGDGQNQTDRSRIRALLQRLYIGTSAAR